MNHDLQHGSSSKSNNSNNSKDSNHRNIRVVIIRILVILFVLFVFRRSHTSLEQQQLTFPQRSKVPPVTGLWLAGNEGMKKKMETTMMGYLETTVRIHSFLPTLTKGKVNHTLNPPNLGSVKL